MPDLEQQERWRQARARLRLEAGEAGFASAGLLGFLDGPGIGVVVLPPDTLRCDIEFDDQLANIVLPRRFDGRTANGISLLETVTTLSAAMVRYSQGEDGWRALVGVKRHGGVTGGIGSVSRYRMERGGREGPEVLFLYMLAHLVRVVVHTQAKVLAWAADPQRSAPISGPYEVIVCVPNSAGLVLGGLNDGWEDPRHAFDFASALESDIAVRHQVGDWPGDIDSLEELALAIIERAAQAFGDRSQRYRSRTGRFSGRMQAEYA